MNNKDKVFELLQENGEMGIDELTISMTDGEVRCSECHQVFPEYHQAREDVREGLRQLIDEQMVGSTPDWNYYIPERHKDD